MTSFYTINNNDTVNKILHSQYINRSGKWCEARVDHKWDDKTTCYLSCVYATQLKIRCIPFITLHNSGQKEV
jgi:hypothetical protein